MSTSTDGARPSVDPSPTITSSGPPPPGPGRPTTGPPGGGAVGAGRDTPAPDPDVLIGGDGGDGEVAEPTPSSWVHEEIRRRVAAGGSAGGGRHARRGIADNPLEGTDYIPRHGGGRTTPAPAQARVRPSVHVTPLPVNGDGMGAAYAPPPPVANRIPEARSAGPGSLPPGATRPVSPRTPPLGVEQVSAAGPAAPPAPAPTTTAPSTPAPPTPAPITPAPPAADPRTTASPPDGTDRAGPATATGQAQRSPTGPPARDQLDLRPPDQEPDADQHPDQPQRIRVVLAERRGSTRAVRTVNDVTDGTGVGDLLRRDLIRSQLGLALRFGLGTVLILGLTPLAFALFPAMGQWEVAGLRLPWLLLGFVAYLLLFGAGAWYARTAERVERDFADHVQE